MNNLTNLAKQFVEFVPLCNVAAVNLKYNPEGCILVHLVSLQDPESKMKIETLYLLVVFKINRTTATETTQKSSHILALTL